jgi:hypothetical protein
MRSSIATMVAGSCQSIGARRLSGGVTCFTAPVTSATTLPH